MIPFGDLESVKRFRAMTDLEKIELSIRRASDRIADEKIAAAMVVLAEQIAADETARERAIELEK